MDPVIKLMHYLRSIRNTPTLAEFLSAFRDIGSTEYSLNKRPDTLFGKALLPIKWDEVYTISLIPRSDLISDVEFKLDSDLNTEELSEFSSWININYVKVMIFAFCENPNDIINSKHYLSNLT